MKEYSRIRKVRTQKRSNSIDYSDISSSVSSKSRTTIPNPIKKTHHHEQEQEQEQEENKKIENKEEISSENGEIFGVILSRKCSVSSYSSSNNNFLSEKQSSLTSFNSALKRTVSSLKRSSSISEGYNCKIHHHHHHPLGVNDDDDDHILMLNTSQSRSVKKKNKGKIFNACKRILGF